METATLPDQRAGVVARDVTVTVADKQLLRSIDLDVRPGELCAVIGVSGSGKSTLLRLLAGVDQPTDGFVSVDGAPALQRTHTIGYVPFGDLVHHELTVEEALFYAATLRLPELDEMTRRERVRQVISELRMESQAEQFVGSLSDGQKRRVACGTELVGAPGALVLDEPTTGLDPDLTRRMMVFLRELADSGLAVILSTHATASLDLCDKIAVMAPGGVIRYTGSQQEILDHYGENTIDGVYDDVHDTSEMQPPLPPAPEPVPVEEFPPLPSLAEQVRVLTSRYATCLSRQKRSMRLLIGQAPVIGLAIALVLPRPDSAGVDLTAYYSMLVTYILAIATIWMGLISASREIASELPALRREVASGVRIDAYLLSKCAVLMPIGALQVLLLLLPLMVVGPVGIPIGNYILAFPVLLAAMVCAIVIGLLVSALARTAGQATLASPIVMIPQLLFAGALISRASMSLPMQLVSDLTPSRWAFSGGGVAFELDEQVKGNVGAITGLESGFFEISPVVCIGILLFTAGGLLAATAYTLMYRMADFTPGRQQDQV